MQKRIEKSTKETTKKAKPSSVAEMKTEAMPTEAEKPVKKATTTRKASEKVSQEQQKPQEAIKVTAPVNYNTLFTLIGDMPAVQDYGLASLIRKWNSYALIVNNKIVDNNGNALDVKDFINWIIAQNPRRITNRKYAALIESIQNTINESIGKKEVRFARLAHPYMSKLRELVASRMKEMPSKVGSVLNWLKNNGVNEAELTWFDINGWIKENNVNGCINKSELLRYIDDLMFDVKEYIAVHDDKKILNTLFRYESLKGGTDYVEFKVAVPIEMPEGKFPPVTHWRESHVVYHFRGQVFDVGGKKIFHIEEIQSDVHQEARYSGYMIGETAERYRAALAENEALFKSGKITEDEYLSRIDEITMEEPLPYYPFEKNWAEQALRRAMLYAIEKGYDGISLTTANIEDLKWGNNQKFEWKKVSDGVFDVSYIHKATIPDAPSKFTRVNGYGEFLQYLEKYKKSFGKTKLNAFAENMWNKMQRKEQGMIRPKYEGMKAFYDEKLVNYLNKFLKSNGFGSVQKIHYDSQLNMDGRIQIVSEDVPCVIFTPEMIESVRSAGIPIFKRVTRPSQGLSIDTVKRILDKPLKQLDGKINIRIINNWKEFFEENKDPISINQVLYSSMRKNGFLDNKGNDFVTAGAFYDNTVVICAGNISTAFDVRQVFMHELMHGGLLKFFERTNGNKLFSMLKYEYENVMDDIYKQYKNYILELRSSGYKFMHGNDLKTKRELTEEWLCNQAHETQHKWYDKIVSIVRRIYRALFDENLHLNDSEIRTIIKESLRGYTRMSEVRFSRSISDDKVSINDINYDVHRNPTLDNFKETLWEAIKTIETNMMFDAEANMKFTEWFGDGKFLDNDGYPSIFITGNDTHYSLNHRYINNNLLNMGITLYTPQQVFGYGMVPYNKGNLSRMRAVWTRAKNPLTIKDIYTGSKQNYNLPDSLIKVLRKRSGFMSALRKTDNIPNVIRVTLQELGYDSIKFLNRYDLSQEDLIKYYSREASFNFNLSDEEFKKEYPSAHETVIVLDAVDVKNIASNPYDYSETSLRDAFFVGESPESIQRDAEERSANRSRTFSNFRGLSSNTSMKREYLDNLIEELGLIPYARKTFSNTEKLKEAFENARSSNPEELINKIRSEHRMPTIDEGFQLFAGFTYIKKEMEHLGNELLAARRMNNPAMEDAILAKMNLLTETLNKHTLLIEESFSKAGGYLQMARLVVNQDLTLADMVSEITKMTGEEISPETMKKLVSIWGNIDKATNEVLKVYGDSAKQIVADMASMTAEEAGFEAMDEKDDIASHTRKLVHKVSEAMQTGQYDLHRLIQELFYYKVQQGMREPIKIAESISEDLGSLYIRMSKREIMDIVSNYGVTTYPSQEEVDIAARQIRSVYRLMSALEDVRKGKVPLKTGYQRDAQTEQEHRLLKQIRYEMKIMGIDAASLKDQTERWKIALESVKTRLRNEIIDLTHFINTGERIPKREPIEYDEESMELKAYRDMLSKIAQECHGIPEERAQKALDNAEKLLLKSIKYYEDKINNKDFSPRGTKTQLSNERIDSLRARRDALLSIYRDMKKEYAKAEVTDEQLIKTQLKRIEKRFEMYKRRIETNDFSTPLRRRTPYDEKIIEAEFRLNKAIREYHYIAMIERMKRRNKLQKLTDFAIEMQNIFRALKTSFDISYVLRQAGLLILAFPKLFVKSFPIAIHAMKSERNELGINLAMSKFKHYHMYSKVGLDLTEANPITREKTEEAYQSRYAEKIWGVGASARAYRTPLNYIRATMFEFLVDKLDRTGTPATFQEMKEIASMINIFTGRSNIGNKPSIINGMNAILFSARLLASRFQVLTLRPIRKSSPRVRREACKIYARFLLSFAIMYAVLSAIGEPPELNPLSADFMKIRKGKTRLDPSAGMSPVIVFSSRMLSRKRMTSKGEIAPIAGEALPYGALDYRQIAGNFLRSKLAPVPSTVLDIYTGSTYMGEKTTAVTVAEGIAAPLIFRDIYEAMSEQGLPSGAIFSILAILGMGLQTYE